MLKITASISIPIKEIEIQAIRAQGAGGQFVNKVSTAIHLRFNIKTSSLPDRYKIRLLNSNDGRITNDGIVVIKAQKYRSQVKNRVDALSRLNEILKQATTNTKKRKFTKPSRASKTRRLDSKTKHGRLKVMRKKVDY